MKHEIRDAMFPVMEVPAYYEITKKNKGKGTSVREVQTGHKFIVREDTGDILSCMSDNYKLITNKQIIEAANPIIKKSGGKLKEVNVFGKGEKLHMNWHFPNHLVKLSNKDEMTPEIVIDNSYNGTVGVNIIAGAFRIICSNGLVIGVVAHKYKNKHIKSNVSLDDFESVISQTIENTKHLMKEEFPVLQDTKFRDRHVIDFLSMFPLQANELVTQALIANSPKSFWDLFNVGTNVLSHHMNRTSQSTHSIERKLYPTVKRWALKEAKVAVA